MKYKVFMKKYFITGTQLRAGGDSPCPTQISLFFPQQKTCFFHVILSCKPEEFFSSSYFYVERVYHNPTFDFIKWHSQQPLSVSSQLVATFQLTQKHLIQLRRLTWFDLTPSPVSVFPVKFPSTFPYSIQAHTLLYVYLHFTKNEEIRNGKLHFCAVPLYSHKLVTDQSTTKRL